MLSPEPQIVTKQKLISSLQGRQFKEITIYEPLNDDVLAMLKRLKKDDKATVVILRSQR